MSGVYQIFGFLFFLLTMYVFTIVAGMSGQETTIMQQQYTLMVAMFGILTFIASIVCFGIYSVIMRMK